MEQKIFDPLEASRENVQNEFKRLRIKAKRRRIMPSDHRRWLGLCVDGQRLRIGHIPTLEQSQSETIDEIKRYSEILKEPAFDPFAENKRQNVIKATNKKLLEKLDDETLAAAKKGKAAKPDPLELEMREIVGKLEYSWIMVVEDWETLQQYKKDKIFLRNGQVQKLEKKFNDAAAACESYRQKWRDRGVLNPVADNEMLALEAAFDKASDENDEVTKINQRVKMVEQLPILTGKPLPIKHYELSPGETIIS